MTLPGAMTVLLIEDQKQSRELVAYMLQSLGVANVAQSPGGVDAIDQLRAVQQPFDLVLCDWMMPGVDGLGVLTELKKRWPETPFLMMTARADQASVAEAISAGVAGYLRKPFTMQDLQARLMAYARKR
jgi:DNA-binding response OmpR family regulator